MICAASLWESPREAVAVAALQPLAGAAQDARSVATPRPPAPAVSIARDPFVAALTEGGDAGPHRSPRDDRPVLSTIPVLPPNDAVAAVTFSAGSERAALRAVVAGSRPFAILEVADKTVLVKPGDVVLGVRIGRIGLGGIVLQDGRRIGFDLTFGAGRVQKE